MFKWIHTVQTNVVQGPAVVGVSIPFIGEIIT